MEHNRLTRKQQKLITDNYKLLSHYINKMINQKCIPPYLEDEFISDIFLRFCVSALKFNEDTGFKFSTYAYGGFNLGLRDILGRKNKKIKKIYHSENIENYAFEYEEVSCVRSDLLKDFISKVDLSVRDTSIIEDYYYNKLSFQKISEKHNISRQYVGLIIKKSLCKIKRVATREKLNIDDFYI